MSAKGFLAFFIVFVAGLGAGYAVFGVSATSQTAPAQVAENNTTLTSTRAMNEAEVRRIVEAYIIENPTVIIRSVDDYQRNGFVRDMEQRAVPFLAHLETMEGAAQMGAEAPEVKIIEFFDYQCPHCKANYPVLERLLAEDPTITLLPKHLPILGDGSENDMSLHAARAAEAARLQGKFPEFHHGLMGREAPLTREAIAAVAAEVGLDMDAFNRDIASEAVATAVAESRSVAEDIGILNAGTPGYIVGGKVMIGAGPDSYDRLKAMVEEARGAD